MSDYTQIVDYSAKDALASGDPAKKILGADIDAEFDAISTAIASKANSASPTLTGTVTVPTPGDTSDAAVAATTAFVRNIVPAGLIVPYGGSTSPDTDIWLLCDGAAVSRTTYATLFGVVSTTFGTGDGSTTFNVPDLRDRSPIGSGTGMQDAVVAAGSVNATDDTFTVASNVDAWVTGMAVQLTTSGTLPGGLATATTYYVIRDSATKIKFATSLANALAGTAIDLTSQGSGNHTVTYTLSSRTLGEKLGEEAHAVTTAEIEAHTHTVTDPGHSHVERGDTDFGSAGAGVRMSAVSDDSTGDTNTATENNTSSATTGISVDNAGGNTAHNNMPPVLVVNYLIKT